MRPSFVCLIVKYCSQFLPIKVKVKKTILHLFSFFPPSQLSLFCLATFHWANCFCDPWNVRGNASFSLAVPRVCRPWPLSSAPVHTQTYTHTNMYTPAYMQACTHSPMHTLALCKRKAIHHRRGTSRPFYSTNTPPVRLPDVTSQQPEITFSCVIITTHLHLERFLFLITFCIFYLVSFSLQFSVCVQLLLIIAFFEQMNSRQTQNFFPSLLKETLKSNHEQSPFEKEFPGMCSKICSSDQLSVYSL